MHIIGYVALALVAVQVYYIVLHYDNILKYVARFKKYRYGIDIIQNYIDPSTSDINDTIVADVRSKRRCVLVGGKYVIASTNGYAIDEFSNRIQYDTLIACIIDMTENYSTMLLSNPCLVNPLSAACNTLLSLLQ